MPRWIVGLHLGLLLILLAASGLAYTAEHRLEAAVVALRGTEDRTPSVDAYRLDLLERQLEVARQELKAELAKASSERSFVGALLLTNLVAIIASLVTFIWTRPGRRRGLDDK
jgi:hypothetical protein